MIPLAVTSLFTAIVSWAVTLWVIKRAVHLRLVQPPNHRSSHSQPTPTGGGLSFFLVTTATWLILLNMPGLLTGTFPSEAQRALHILIGFAFVMGAMGIADDIFHLSAKIRLPVQLFLCASLLYLTQYPSLAPVSFASLALILILLFTFAWWVNIYNFMDGIDGLAASQAIFMLVTAAGLGLTSSTVLLDQPLLVLMLVTASSIAGFLILNWSPAKIFMGDAGSTWLGFVLFGLALVSHDTGWLPLAAWLILGAVFFCDATITLATRFMRGDPWYEAHRSHAYQLLAIRWAHHRLRGHRAVTLLVLAINILWLTPFAFLANRWPTLAPGCVIIAYTPIIIGVIKVRSGDRNAQNNTPARRQARHGD